MSTVTEEASETTEPKTNKWVYLFDEGPGDDKTLLGGKGAGLCEMTQAGLPVPPGLVVTTEACNAFFDNDKTFPEGLWEQVKEGLTRIAEKVGKKFGDAKNPLLVSVRSGAAFSMPGVLDRFKALTQGGRDTDLKADHLREIIAAEKQIILTEQQAIPEDPYEQLQVAIAAVFNSWMGRRAVDYRRINRIADSLGTAVNVQAMVFGNMGSGSGTGVAFTRDPNTGENTFYGAYLINAQGEDVVAGIRIAVEMVQEGLIDEATAVQRVSPDSLNHLLLPQLDPKSKNKPVAQGI